MISLNESSFSNFMLEVVNTILLAYPDTKIVGMNNTCIKLDIRYFRNYVDLHDHIDWVVLQSRKLTSSDLRDLKPLTSVFNLRPIIEHKSLLIEPLENSLLEEALSKFKRVTL